MMSSEHNKTEHFAGGLRVLGNCFIVALVCLSTALLAMSIGLIMTNRELAKRISCFEAKLNEMAAQNNSLMIRFYSMYNANH